MPNPRKLAAIALMRVEKEGAYSHLVLGTLPGQQELSSVERAFVSALFYGTLERSMTLEYLLAKQMKKPFSAVSDYTAAVLKTALYQILYMDKVPESAAVNEAVKLIKHSKETRNAGFVNAVLRAVIRAGVRLPQDDSLSSLSVRFSCPTAVVDSLISDYGLETAKAFLADSLTPAKTALRVNTLKISAEELIERLREEGIEAEKGPIPNCLILEKGLDIAASPLYREGLFFVQDPASQTAISHLALRPGERVLDLCAAPGGKSFAMALLMDNKGELFSYDLSEKRAGLIEQGARRLGIQILKAAAADACVFDPDRGQFDRVLCDVPCSGWGVIRRKPEIKRKVPEDLQTLPEIQYTILKNAGKYVNSGGYLMYSTCTLRREENEKVVNRFQMEYNEFCKRYEHTFFPHIDQTDGFYCALLQKR